MEIRFFGPDDEIPREILDASDSQRWVWWRQPRDYVEVWLVGETKDDWTRRLNLRSSNGNGARGKA